jgi:hypothetical protein
LCRLFAGRKKKEPVFCNRPAKQAIGQSVGGRGTDLPDNLSIGGLAKILEPRFIQISGVLKEYP